MSWIDIISAGPGDAKLLTIRAQEALEAAGTVFCAARYEALAGDKSKICPLTPFAEALERMAACGREGCGLCISRDQQPPGFLCAAGDSLAGCLHPFRPWKGTDAFRLMPGSGNLSADAAADGREP